VDLKRRQALAAAARRRGVTIIEDDIYGLGLAGDDTAAAGDALPEGVVYLSLSKCVAPGCASAT
jgi:DNA-binding transcriptional MocR family regulator